MVINPSTHYPDNRVQGLPSVGIEVLPREVSQAFQLGRKAVLPAGKFQPLVPFARSSPVAGNPQKIERTQTFSSLICPRRRHVARSKELRFVFVKFEAKPAQPFRQHAVEAFRLVLVSSRGPFSSACVFCNSTARCTPAREAGVLPRAIPTARGGMFGHYLA